MDIEKTASHSHNTCKQNSMKSKSKIDGGGKF